jgi:hypothetical protein
MHSIVFNYATVSLTNTWLKNETRNNKYQLRNSDLFILPPFRIELLKNYPFTLYHYSGINCQTPSATNITEQPLKYLSQTSFLIPLPNSRVYLFLFPSQATQAVLNSSLKLCYLYGMNDSYCTVLPPVAPPLCPPGPPPPPGPYSSLITNQ